MRDSEESLEIELSATREAVSSFAAIEHEVLVRKAIYRLQRMHASGIFGDQYSYKSLWDEYCHEVQEGPHDLLDQAWEQTLEGVLDSLIESIPRHVAVLLSMSAAWDIELEEESRPMGAVWADGLKRLLRSRLTQEAATRNLANLRS